MNRNNAPKSFKKSKAEKTQGTLTKDIFQKSLDKVILTIQMFDLLSRDTHLL